MNDTVKWITSVIAVGVIGFIVELLLGESRLTKITRAATAAVALLVVVTPLPKLLSTKINFDGFEIDCETEIDESYAEYIDGLKRGAIERAIAARLRARGIEGAVVTVSGSDEQILVEINLSESVIDGKNEHINMNELAYEVACGELGIARSRVKVYE